MKTTKYALAAMLGLVALMAPGAVRADTITLFNANGTFITGTTLSGTVTINTSMGLITAINLVTSGGGFDLTFTTITSQGATASSPSFYGALSSSGGTQLNLFILSSTLQGYLGGALCGGPPANCVSPSVTFFTALRQGISTPNPLTSGSLAPVPEPTTIILLGTGLVGVLGRGLRRKRLA